MGAAGPLVLEYGDFFLPPTFVPIWQFFNFTTICTTNVYHRFYHKFYHKLLPQTTIIIRVSISTTTPIFVPIQQFFNFTTTFTTHFYHIFYHKFNHKLLPQTTILIGKSISTTTPIFVPIRQFFNFTTHFTIHVTTNFTTNHYHYLHRPPWRFIYLWETHTKVLRGLKIFLLHPIRLSLGRK